MADYITEIFYDSAWQGITADVRNSAPIALNRGRTDWASVGDPATCTFTLNNGVSNIDTDVIGRYSPRNPRSDLFGKIGRNTPVRVRRTTREQAMETSGEQDSFADTPDDDSLDVTGDIDLRFDLELETWHPSDRVGFGRKYVGTGDQRSWIVFLNVDGALDFRWSPDGTVGASLGAASSDQIDADAGRVRFRVTLDVDDGSGDHVVTWYTADSIDGPWTQFGDQLTGSGTTSVFASTADLELGRTSGDGFSTDPMIGRFYAFEMRDGIDGTVVADPRFDQQEPETREFTDDAGAVWTLQEKAFITDPAIRFTGEATKWPVRWPLAGGEGGWVPFTASGLQRRLQRGTKPLKSSLFRDLSERSEVVAYWPLEDPEGSTTFASGREGDVSVLRPRDLPEVDFAADNTFIASAPLPTVGASTIRGPVPSYEGADDQRFLCVISIPSDVTWSTDKLLFRFFTTGSIQRWDLTKTVGDGTRLQAFDEDGTEVENQLSTLPLFGDPHAVSLLLQQDGSDVVWQWARFPLDGSQAFVFGNTISGETYGRFSHVFLGSTNDVEGTAFGHAAILNDDVESIWDVIRNSMIAWTGETGAERLQRLAADESLPLVRIIGDTDDVETMGPQRLLTLMNLFREVPTADLGLLDDRPDLVGLQYRPRVDLYNQTPALTLDYSNGVIAEPFEPIDDDQNTRNDITVNRVRGSSFTLREETGPLSVQNPPDGVGKYDISQDLNIDDDDRLPAQAGWRLHLGTVDEARFPTLRLNLRNKRVALLEDEILAVRLGDVIEIENPPEWLPPGPYLLLVEAIGEEKTAETHYVTFTCSPGSAWEVLTVDDDPYDRLDTGSSELAAAIEDTDTELLVATQSGSQVWVRTSRGLLLPGETGSYASTSDDDDLDITGDIDVRVEVSRDDWGDIASEEVMIAKYRDSTDDRSWRFSFNDSGLLQFRWTEDGTVGTLQTETSSVVPPRPSHGRVAYRVTLDVSTGDVTFYWAESTDDAFDQVGEVQTGSSTSIFSGDADLEVGARDDGGQTPWNGTVYRIRVRDGISGTLVAHADFLDEATGTTAFTDDVGLPWTVHGDAEIGPNDGFFIKVGGEVMQVEEIEGDTSPQTFHVVRTAGLERATTPAGAAVELARPAVIAL